MTSLCEVCGGNEFRFEAVLWDELVEAWGLSQEERKYIDRQQGECCSNCGANLRSIALAGSIRSHLGMSHWLKDEMGHRRWRKLKILELNEAGTLSPLLSQQAGHVLGCYPEVDMQAMDFPDESFDLVVHSDTLEHVPDPVKALSECHRVLRPGGACCFTIPIIIGRLSRRRDGLPPSWHGEPGTSQDDWSVQTEYGADAWCQVLEAGFSKVTLTSVAFPCAVAMAAVR
ncbi:MAG: class I SAM-dependent methyltransferase [Phycisphaerales bacterium]|nr:class I SAM-dependent methyltransferase [Phycisphaerales bacterium]